MEKRSSFAAEVNTKQPLGKIKLEAKGCTACHLYKFGTQTVFGEGPLSAEIMIVGEQPGNEEDVAGKPFVGPAGAVLDAALAEAGLTRKKVYVTNAVKHFKWAPRGKRRLHQKPNGAEMQACKPWLLAEVEKIKPKVIVAMGVTAGTSVLGRLPKITKERGKLIGNCPLAEKVILSWHPSAILRSIDKAGAEKKKKELIHDLKLAAKQVNSL